MKTHYSTRQAAAKIGVSFRTLNRWIATGAIKASQGIPLTNGGYLWLWTDSDVAKGLKVKTTLKPGRKSKSTDSTKQEKGPRK
jgi:predicted site-specific integrase-resolvase